MRSALLATALLLTPLVAHAQWSPSADDLVNQLKLRPGGATRGIRALGSEPVAPAAAPSRSSNVAVVSMPMAPAARSAPVAASAAPQGTANLTVLFESGSDKLTPNAVQMLNTLGRALSSPTLAADKFSIVGHTDSVGAADANQTLSERRAEAVVSYITTHFSVDPARLSASGKGMSDPLVATPTNVPELRNRRVQIINLGS